MGVTIEVRARPIANRNDRSLMNRVSFPFLSLSSPSVLQKIAPGDGSSFPKKGDSVTIHYTGKLTDGTVFDSSVTRGQPFKCTIGVGQVIKGWDEGVPQLSLGEKAVLTCTPDYAYGSRGFPPLLPPNATLTFEVQLLGIN
ncbi:FK506-binding protein 1, partial [Tremellales sp. Uapishka_1]